MNRPSCFGGIVMNSAICRSCKYTEGCLERQQRMGIYEDHLRMQEKGRKDDSTKPRWSLLPRNTITEVIKVLEFGAKKYQVDNWQHVPDARTRYYDAVMRHVEAWWLGEQNDPESKLPHLAHAACCLLFLMWFDRKDALMAKAEVAAEELAEVMKRRDPRVGQAKGQDWMSR